MIQNPILASALVGRKKPRPRTNYEVIDLTALKDAESPALSLIQMATGGYEMAGGSPWQPFRTKRGGQGAYNPQTQQKLYGEDARRALQGNDQYTAKDEDRRGPKRKAKADEKARRKAMRPGGKGTEGQSAIPGPEAQPPAQQKKNRSRAARVMRVAMHKAKKRFASAQRKAKWVGDQASKAQESGYDKFREWGAARLENLGVSKKTGRKWMDTAMSFGMGVLGLVGLGSGGSVIARAAKQAVYDSERVAQKKAGIDTKSRPARDASDKAVDENKALGWAGLADTLQLVVTIAAGAAGAGWVGAAVGGLIGMNVPLGSTFFLACQGAKRAVGAVAKALFGVGEASEFRPKHIVDRQAEEDRKGAGKEMATDGGPQGKLDIGKVIRHRIRAGWDVDWWMALFSVLFDHSGHDFRKAMKAADRAYKAHPKPPEGEDDEMEDLADKYFQSQLEPTFGDGPFA